MYWNVTEVRPQDGYTLRVRFRDGMEGEVKFMPSAFRGAFKHLHDTDSFGKVALVDGVVTWPGDIDLAPDAMHAEIKLNGRWVLE